MRFFKIFLVSFASVVGVVGVALGGMFVTGGFDEEIINPEVIAFEQTDFEVTNDFEMTLTSSTDGVTVTEVSLSFANSTSTQNESEITDGIITVPKTVFLGTPFTVKLNEENKLINGQMTPWIKGGISTLRATSVNVNVRVVEADVYVDVPVHSIELETKAGLQTAEQNTFNIDGEFWAQAKFTPSESAYKFSRDGSDGNEPEYKKVFFSTLSDKLEQVSGEGTHDTQKFKAIQPADNVRLTGQVFTSVSDEVLAYEQIADLQDEDLIGAALLSILDTIEPERKVQANAYVNFEELEVQSYSVEGQTIPSVFNSPITLFANNANLQTNQYDLGVEILASDDESLLQDEISNIGVAVAIEGALGLEPSNTSQFMINGSSSAIANFYGQDFTFYFPIVHTQDINNSYWDIVALNENLNAKLIVVLFERTQEGTVVSEHSVENGNPIYDLTVDPATTVSNQVYWNTTNIDESTLYIYDNENESQKIYQQYDLKDLEYVIPSENSYKTVLYFAYLEDEGGVVSSDYLEKYLAIGSGKAIYQTSSDGDGDITLYEIPNGVLTPKDTEGQEFPEGSVIRVVFATVKTTANGAFVYDGDGNYEIDRFSSNSSLGTLQTLSFDVSKTLKSIDAFASFDESVAVLTGDGVLEPRNLAFVNGQPEAFRVYFNVPNDQKEIFVRDWNNNKIKVLFDITGITEQELLSYQFESFAVEEDNENQEFYISVNADYITYVDNDPGYRNFSMQVYYQRGYEEPVYTNLTNFAFVTSEGTEQYENVLTEIYDGKIDTLTYAMDPETVVINQENPINVSTSLEADTQTAHPKTGISYANNSSTSSYTLGGNSFNQDVLYYENSKNVRINAFDKYGREIDDSTLWTLVSDDSTETMLSIDATGQSMNFLATTTDPIKVSIESDYGVGGRKVTSEYPLYFTIDTFGKIVKITKNQTQIDGEEQTVYSNIDSETHSTQLGVSTFELLDDNETYEETTISISVEGAEDNIYNLTKQGEVNLFNLYYALPYGTYLNPATGLDVTGYQIFDLLKITKIVREDEIPFEGFIDFQYEEGSSRYITGFEITNTFGQTGYLNLKAETEIGINVNIRIEIKPTFTVVVAPYGHELEGAQGGFENSIDYTGVYSREAVYVTFSFEAVDVNFGGEIVTSSNFTPLLYVYDASLGEDRVIAINGDIISKPYGNNTVNFANEMVTVAFILDDVEGFTYGKYVFVLDSRTNIDISQAYVKQTYDYSRDMHLLINPNIDSSINTSNADLILSEQNANQATVSVAQPNIIQVLTEFDISGNPLNQTNTLINVFRKQGSSDLTLNLGSNYVVARITQANGVIIPEDELRYFKIEDNMLKLISPFTESATVYITLFHYVNASTYNAFETFEITLVPDIVINDAFQLDFVTYNEKTYLQLESDSTYTYSQLAERFAVSAQGQYNLIVNFDDEYVNQSTYWVISGQEILVNTTTQIVADRLNIEVAIMAELNGMQAIAKINFPVILMPIAAPLIQYNEDIENIVGTDTIEYLSRNNQANSDLANLLSLEYLVENNVYDTVEDGLNARSLFNGEEFNSQTIDFGYNFNNVNVLYTVLNGDGTSGTTSVARVENGNLFTNFVGEDTYVIVVANIRGLNVYYRLKIVSSLELVSMYPYADKENNLNFELTGEDKAEYILYKPGDDAKTILFTGEFDDVIPAKGDLVDNVYDYVYNDQTDSYDLVESPTYINNRIMMFRNLIGESIPEAKQLMSYSVKSISVKSISLGTMKTSNRPEIAQANYAYYVNINIDENGDYNVVLNNVESYVAVIQIETMTNATQEYVFAVEQTQKVYEVVSQTEEGQNISQMTPIADDYKISIASPVMGETNTSDELFTKNLKMTFGEQVQDATSLLRFNLYNNVYSGEELLSIDESNQIVANYTVNTINADLMFYTIYGPVKVVTTSVESLVKIVDFEYNEALYDGSQASVDLLENNIVDSQTVFAGREFKLSEEIKFIQIAESSASLITVPNLVWNSVNFEGFAEGQTPDFINKVESTVDEFVIYPINQNTSHMVTMIVNVTINSQTFEFEYDLNIQPAIEAVNENNLNLLPISGNYYATNTIAIDVFDVFYNNAGEVIALTALDDQITGNLDETDMTYLLEITAISGANYIQNSRTISEGMLVLETNAVAYSTDIVLKADLIFSVQEHAFVCTAYAMVTLSPDSSVEINYPAPSGEELEFESVFYGSASINFDEAADFQTESRIDVTALDGNEDKDIYLTYEVVDGETDSSKFVVSGGILFDGQADKYDYTNSAFAFSFENSSFTFATIDFEVFVSGISRGIYTVKVYEDVSDVYQLNINYINEVDGRNEVFYIGEDRKDIFNSVQAFSFELNNTTNILSEETTVTLYKQIDAETQINLNVEFVLNSYDRGASIVHKLEETNNDFSGLSLENIRFRINYTGDYLTVSQMTAGEGAFFTIDEYGNSSFQIVRRLNLTYLGFDVLDDEFLSNVQIQEEGAASSSSYEAYNIDMENNFGDTVYEKTDNLVKIYIGNTHSEVNSLGTYYYSVKVNLEIVNAEQVLQITAGQEITQILGVLGVTDRSGNEFVTYPSGTPQVVSKVVDRDIVFSLSLTDELGKLNLIDAVTEEAYTKGESVTPIRSSTYFGINGDSESYNYDFSLFAFGAPNNGLIGEMKFEYQVRDKGSTEYVSFIKNIRYQISPNYDVTLYNSLGGANSENNPEVINKDIFNTSTSYRDTFVDTQNAELTKVFIYQINNLEAGNQAVNFNYRITVPDTTTGIASISGLTDGEGNIINRGIMIQKPEFAERVLEIEIYDEFDYKVTYYYSVKPDEEISFIEMTGNSVYEGNTFIIENNDNEDSDNVIMLSSSDFTDVVVAYKLRKAENDEDLNAIVDSNYMDISTESQFGYIDGGLFSEVSRTLLVYLEIELVKDLGEGSFESYIINTNDFYLRQRYGAEVGATEVRDGYEFNLINHVEIMDYKETASIGEPILTDEKTLVISDPDFHGSIDIVAYNASTSKSATISIEQPSAQSRYYMMSEIFAGDIADVNSYSYRISNITDYKYGGDEYYVSISAGNDSITLTSYENTALPDDFVVHMYNGTRYVDVVAKLGENPSLTSGSWSIIGYEYDGDSGLGSDDIAQSINIEEELGQQKVVLGKNNSIPYSLTLQNFGTIYQGVETLNITRRAAATPSGYEIVIESKNDMHIYEEPVASVEINLVDSNASSYSANGEDWAIVNVEYNGAGYEPFEFLLKEDKSVSMVTVEDESKVIKVNFNGDNRYIEFILDSNTTQVKSILEEFDGLVDPAGVFLKNQPIEGNDLTTVKGMTYYNDTLEILASGSLTSANMTARLYRTRNEQTTFYEFVIAVKPYDYTFSIGISNAFGEIVEIGDEYSLKIVSMPGVIEDELTSIQVRWPNTQSYVTVTQDFTAEATSYGTYNVATLNEIEIVNGLTTINLDSKDQYDNDGIDKIVNVNRYYIIEFKNAFYVLDAVTFEVSPYYYSIDTTEVYSLQGQNVVTDYSQIINGNDISYIVDFETWARDIYLKDSLNNRLYEAGTDNYLELTSTEISEIMKFDIEDGGSGQGTLNEHKALVTTGEIELGVTYFTISVKVALNGEEAPVVGEDYREWLEIGRILLSFDTNQQAFLDSSNNYTISITDQMNGYTPGNEMLDGTKTYVRYFEIDGDNPVTFSTNKLFDEENISTFETIQTMVTDLNNVYLTDKNITNYDVSYRVDENTEAHMVMTTQFINTGSQDPIITVSGLESNESVSLNVENADRSVVYEATYQNNSDQTMFGEIALSNFVLTNTSTQATTDFASLSNLHTNWKIIPNSSDVYAFWTYLDLAAFENQLETQFFGMSTTNGGTSGLISNITASKVFKLMKMPLAQNNLTTVQVLVDEKEAAEPNTDYFAITQIQDVYDVDHNKLDRAQTYFYEASNNETTKEFVQIYLNSWNRDYFTIPVGPEYDYESSLVIVEKLSGEETLNASTLALLDGGYYSYDVGYYNTNSKHSAKNGFVSQIQIVNNNSIVNVEKVDLSEMLLVDTFGTYSQEIIAPETIDEEIITKQAGIYVKSLSSSSLGNIDTVDVDFNITSSQFANIITKSVDEQIVGQETVITTDYTYKFVNNDALATLSLEFDTSVQTTASSKIILIDVDGHDNLIWNELDDQILPLEDMRFFTEYNDISGKFEAQNATNKNTAFTTLQNGDMLSDFWDGILSIEGDFEDDDYMQITYGEEADPDYEVMYFRFGAYRLPNTNRIKVAQIYKDLVGLEYDNIALNVSRFSRITPIQDNVSSLDYASGVGTYKIAYDGSTFAVFDYKANGSQNTGLFDIVKQDVEGTYENLDVLYLSKFATTLVDEQNDLNWQRNPLDAAFYAFAQEGTGKFEIVDLVNTATYDLFEIFNTDIILSIDGDITVNKLKSELTIFSDTQNPGVSFVYIVVYESDNVLEKVERSVMPPGLEPEYTITLEIDGSIRSILTSDLTISYFESLINGDPIADPTVAAGIDVSVVDSLYQTITISTY